MVFIFAKSSKLKFCYIGKLKIYCHNIVKTKPFYYSVFLITGKHAEFRVRGMVFNATFYNVSVKPWQSVLLVVKTRVPAVNHRSVTSY
jgi:hypothetical protein